MFKNNSKECVFIGSNQRKVLFKFCKKGYDGFHINQFDLVYWNQKIEDLPRVRSLEGFDYGIYLRELGVEGVVKSNATPCFYPSDDGFVFTFSQRIKQAVINNILEANDLSQVSKGTLIALLTGDKSFIEFSEKDLYRRAGVSHVFAVSGMHIGIIYFLLNLVLKYVVRLKVKFSLPIVLLVLFLFSLISGLTPSIMRACLMFSLIHLGSVFNSKTNTISVVLICASIMVVINRDWIYDLGFQLSFLAVIGIVLTLDRIPNYSKYKLINKVEESFKVGVGAFVFTFPLLAFNFDCINFSSLFTGIIIIPFISLIMYIGIISILLPIQGLKSDLFLIVNHIIEFLVYGLTGFVNRTNLTVDVSFSLFETVFCYSIIALFFIKFKYLKWGFVFSSCFLMFSSPDVDLYLLNTNSSLEVVFNKERRVIGSNDTLNINNLKICLVKDDSVDKSLHFSVLMKDSESGEIMDSIAINNYHKITLDY